MLFVRMRPVVVPIVHAVVVAVLVTVGHVVTVGVGVDCDKNMPTDTARRLASALIDAADELDRLNS